MVGEIRRVLKNDLHFYVKEMEDPDAKLDGGDVLFTGKEIFVGTGKRTNDKGAVAVANTFCDYDVAPIDISDTNVLHLKEAVNVIGKNELVVAGGDGPRKIMKVGEIRRVLKNDLHFYVKEMEDPDAKLDGGDVLFTGKEIFVGTGKRTNDKGAVAVANTFCDYDVAPIDISDTNVLHLKEAVNVIGKNELVVAGGDGPRKIMKRMDCLKSYNYKVLQMPSTIGADMLYVNGRLIHRANEELTKESYGLLDEKLQCTRHQLPLREMTKVQGTISGMCILLRINRNMSKIPSNITDPDLTQFLSINPHQQQQQ